MPSPTIITLRVDLLERMRYTTVGDPDSGWGGYRCGWNAALDNILATRANDVGIAELRDSTVAPSIRDAMIAQDMKATAREGVVECDLTDVDLGGEGG